MPRLLQQKHLAAQLRPAVYPGVGRAHHHRSERYARAAPGAVTIRRRSAASGQRAEHLATGETGARRMPRQGYLAVDRLPAGGAGRTANAGGGQDQRTDRRQVRAGFERPGADLARQQQPGGA